MSVKECENGQCSECETKFTDNQRIIYHKEVGAFFCDDACANQYDMQFRDKAVNIIEPEEDDDDSEEIEEEDEGEK